MADPARDLPSVLQATHLLILPLLVPPALAAGGGRGIGRATALELARLDAGVAALARSRE